MVNSEMFYDVSVPYTLSFDSGNLKVLFSIVFQYFKHHIDVYSYLLSYYSFITLLKVG